MPLHIMIADDHEVIRAGLKLGLERWRSDVEIVEAGCADEVLQQAASVEQLDLVLLDLTMPGMQGLDLVKRLSGEHPALPLIVISAHDDPHLMRQILQTGVSGFIPKREPMEVIIRVVELVLTGGTYIPREAAFMNGTAQTQESNANALKVAVSSLTPRQKEILALIHAGQPNKTIASQLGITEGTVKAQIYSIFRALKARNRTHAMSLTRDLI